MSEQTRILAFLPLAERLKAELRHSWLSSGRQESVAEPCFQMALMALLVHRHLAQPVDLCKTLRTILVLDLVARLDSCVGSPTGDARWRPGGHDGMMPARERLLRSIELPRPSSGAAETTKRGPET